MASMTYQECLSPLREDPPAAPSDAVLLGSAHRQLTFALERADVRNPARLLALTIIATCNEDAARGKGDVSLDPFWVHAAEVPIEWLEDLGIGVFTLAFTPSRRRQRTA